MRSFHSNNANNAGTVGVYSVVECMGRITGNFSQLNIDCFKKIS